MVLPSGRLNEFSRAMYSRKLKTGVFVLEALSALAATSFFYYFYFYTHRQFGFGNQANLMLAAAAGLTYVPASILGGRFAQRAGYFAALKLGFAIVLGALIAGCFLLNSACGEVAVMLTATAGMCLIWPTFEGLVSEGEDYAGLQRNVGIYNMVWAGGNAVAFFCVGALLERLGLNNLFFLPIAIVALQLGLTFFLARAAKKSLAGKPTGTHSPSVAPAAGHPRPPETGRAFLRMAWLANPFCYIAINTLIAMMPGVAQRLGWSTAMAGVYGSVWCFSRLATFFGLWFWPGWHYRFRWMLAAFLGLIGSFTVILLGSHLGAVITAEITFGIAIGLIYYSSLFYSMDVGDTKGEHGGIHEAAIGLGNCVGPAVGAVSLQFLPGTANAGALAVSVLLLGGLAALLSVWRMTRVERS